jgi:hypothetical protein
VPAEQRSFGRVGLEVAATDVERVAQTVRLRFPLPVKDSAHRLNVEYVIARERPTTLPSSRAGERVGRFDYSHVNVLAVHERDSEQAIGWRTNSSAPFIHAAS